MIIRSITINNIINDREFDLANVSEIVVTNFGTSTLFVNGRKVRPNWSITFMRGVFTEHFNLRIWFENDGNQQNEAEISYLINDNGY